ncbi:radical SAM protein [Chitinophaga sp. RAB17]|uniref:radical SAM protein n=1 Tax=Chitinophaga sp. RAB17 TaxID=3233049 RepID=UPI003F912B63
MKLSRFNNAVGYKDKVVLYNSRSNNFLLVDPMLQELMEAGKTSSNIEELANYHPQFYKALQTKGFIVEETLDEIQAVKDWSARVDGNESTYHLVINPTMNCNFKCWYCYESHIKDSKMSEFTLDNIRKHIVSVLQNKPGLKFFHIDWFGGEPLLFFDKVIDPILDYGTKICQEYGVAFSTSFTTNAFLINPAMIERFKLYKITDFQITLDGNRDTHNKVRFVNAKRGSYDEIVANVAALCTAGFHVTQRINYTKNTLDNLESIADDLQQVPGEFRRNISISLHKVWQVEDETLNDRVTELIQYFISAGFYAAYGGTPDNVKHSCYADKKNHATINYNGEVYKCTARNFSSETREGLLNDDGSITWNEKFEERMNIKFKNKPCLSCPIMPICNGGCSQVALENKGEDYCVYNFKDYLKKEMVLNKFLETLNSKALKIA